ncbi:MULTISPECIES: D-arabinono-1,4-lactone oxidase [unclassified Plantactinospora]|uniref:D-arabinono-1,4-lactone oxidase n=1 Tax=unclassified Plantactinospora TaxID=2631981 RepID=UPI000D15DF0B|nr:MULTISPECIES: D-arabinono-1,4-lactone oxidase [unclassified Plantactinospora]AVT33599.1 FAD-binding protein [Plantactinospora sp. BC1]AVT39563.1 FAD-binding protein [Plantactinospora sp. BB1]
MTIPLSNWAGNVDFRARRLHRPTSLAELRSLVAGSDRIRALGTAHSFNRIADTTGDLVSVAGLPPVLEIDRAAGTVTVSAALRYGDLVGELDRAGLALHNLGSLPHISVAGACATGTHGSGPGNGNLATAVAALELVTADGELLTLRRGDDDFLGAVVGLGALGVVTRLTLDLVPAFEIAQYVYDDLPREQLDAHSAEILGGGYSVSLFTDWTGPRINQVWVKRRTDVDGGAAEPHWYGGTLAAEPRHPVPGMSAVHCTEQLGVPGPWHARLPHFRLEFTPSSGEELQSEYFVPREHLGAAMAALDGIADRIAAVLQISEIRTIAADELWLSPSHRRDSAALHFTWVKETEAVLPVLAAVEERLAPYAPRPHWGKLFGTPPEQLRDRYDRYADFAKLIRRYDPSGKFRNEMLDRYFPAAG